MLRTDHGIGVFYLGCSPAQAKRLWATIANELVQVSVEGKTYYLLAADSDSVAQAACDNNQLLLLGAHDPYLDPRGKK